MTDTIVAIASPAGRGAVGIVRLSGPDVPRIAQAILESLPPPRRAVLSVFRGAGGESLDEGIALYFPAPASFTGEPVLELQGHGGPVVLDRLIQRTLELGCRRARAGEFSERAYVNGKMDIAEAEGIAALIEAGTAAAARAAVRSMQGEFSSRIADLQRALTALRIEVEATIDFAEEDIDEIAREAIDARIAGLCEELGRVAAAARQGMLLKDGITVVIAGPPNAGKSSLLNRLAGADVAIVTPAAGTTRDVLSARIEIDGLPVNLIDTAGLRDALDAAEAEGIRRARNEIERADLVLWVEDAGAPGGAAATAPLPAGVPVTRVLNKIDLLSEAPRVDTGPGTRLEVSAKTGAGLERLRVHLKTAVGYESAESGALAARRRHLDALDRARCAIQNAGQVMKGAGAFDLFAEELRLAQRALGEITGEFTPEDLLGEIFRSFCIGK